MKSRFSDQRTAALTLVEVIIIIAVLGAVTAATAHDLRELLYQTGVTTNRLVIP